MLTVPLTERPPIYGLISEGGYQKGIRGMAGAEIFVSKVAGGGTPRAQSVFTFITVVWLDRIVKGVQGEGAKQFINHIPGLLCNELLKVAAGHRKNKGVVLDLCCGWSSMEEPAHLQGMHYVGQDLREATSSLKVD